MIQRPLDQWGSMGIRKASSHCKILRLHYIATKDGGIQLRLGVCELLDH